jgi:hypothetical protein
MDWCVFELPWALCVSSFRPGAHLPRLKTIFDTYPQTIEHRGHTLINFKRYHEFSSEMMKLAQYKGPNLEHDPDTISSLLYLEDRLSTVRGDNEIEHFIMRRSRSLEEEERQLEQQRVPQLRGAGFRV